MINPTPIPARHANGESRLDAERELVRAALLRLTTGRAERSNGGLTVSALATESGISRQRLYEHHHGLLAEFRTAVTGQPPPPEVAALQRQLEAAHARISEGAIREAQLVEKIKTLCALVTELTHEAHTQTVVELRRPHRRSP